MSSFGNHASPNGTGTVKPQEVKELYANLIVERCNTLFNAYMTELSTLTESQTEAMMYILEGGYDSIVAMEAKMLEKFLDTKIRRTPNEDITELTKTPCEGGFRVWNIKGHIIFTPPGYEICRDENNKEGCVPKLVKTVGMHDPLPSKPLRLSDIPNEIRFSSPILDRALGKLANKSDSSESSESSEGSELSESSESSKISECSELSDWSEGSELSEDSTCSSNEAVEDACSKVKTAPVTVSEQLINNVNADVKLSKNNLTQHGLSTLMANLEKEMKDIFTKTSEQEIKKDQILSLLDNQRSGINEILSQSSLRSTSFWKNKATAKEVEPETKSEDPLLRATELRYETQAEEHSCHQAQGGPPPERLATFTAKTQNTSSTIVQEGESKGTDSCCQMETSQPENATDPLFFDPLLTSAPSVPVLPAMGIAGQPGYYPLHQPTMVTCVPPVLLPVYPQPQSCSTERGVDTRHTVFNEAIRNPQAQHCRLQPAIYCAVPQPAITITTFPPMVPIPEHPMGAVPDHQMGVFPGHPIGAFPEHPMGAFPGHPIGTFPEHPMGAFPNHQMGAFPEHPMGAVPDHQMGVFPGHPIGAFPDHPMGAFPGHPVGTFPGQPMEALPKHPMERFSGYQVAFLSEPVTTVDTCESDGGSVQKKNKKLLAKQRAKKAAIQRAAAEKAAAKKAAKKAAAQKAAAEQASVEKVAKKLAEVKQLIVVAEQKLAAQTADAEKKTFELIAKKRAAQEAAAERAAAAAERAAMQLAIELDAAERAAVERAAAEQEAADRVVAEQLAIEQYAADRAAVVRDAEERAAAVKASAERAAAIKADIEKRVAEVEAAETEAAQKMELAETETNLTQAELDMCLENYNSQRKMYAEYNAATEKEKAVKASLQEAIEHLRKLNESAKKSLVASEGTVDDLHASSKEEISAACKQAEADVEALKKQAEMASKIRTDACRQYLLKRFEVVGELDDLSEDRMVRSAKVEKLRVMIDAEKAKEAEREKEKAEAVRRHFDITEARIRAMRAADRLALNTNRVIVEEDEVFEATDN